MRFTRAFFPTLREDPAEADTPSHRLLLRGGYIQRVASGIYEWLPLGLRVLRRIEAIIREEMNAIGGQEVLLPALQPKEAWKQSGRWDKYGKELFRLQDRKEADFCLAATAEEVVTALAARHLRSWRSLPVMLYQISMKYRDEIRPRFGILRAREFLMKDAYSFHADEEDAQRYYEVMDGAYRNIFDRIGLRYRAVEADTGQIGGNFSHEFMVLAETGEDIVAYCPQCAYAANLDRAECSQVEGVQPPASNGQRPEDVATPGKFTVDDVSKFLGLPPERFIKTMFYWAGKIPALCLLRGDHEINESKLSRLFNGAGLTKMEKQDYEKWSGSPVGFAGPQGQLEKARKFHPEAVVLADYAVAALSDGVSGANKSDHHSRHLSYGRDFSADRVVDLRRACEGDLCPRCGKGKFAFQRGIEVGHIFKLGTKYSVFMGAQYADQKGVAHPMVMGCYGIGVSRIVAAAAEQNNDKWGILWPRSIAPFDIGLVSVDAGEPEIQKAAGNLYQKLKDAGLDVLWDDRSEHAGVKFKDSDLMGIPVSLRVSRRSLAQGSAEVKARNAPSARLVGLEDSIQAAKDELAGYLLIGGHDT